MHSSESPIRILHVDDNDLDRELIRIHLQRRDRALSIIEADSVASAVNMLALERFDLILCDYQMPGEDGLVLLHRLNEERKDIPFIFLTGQGNEGIAAEALRLGADDYFAKDSGFAQYERLVNSIRRTVIAHRQDQDRRHADDMFRVTFEQAAVGMAHTSLDGRYILVNRKLCDILGRAERDILNTSWQEITHPDDIGPESRIFQRIHDGELDTAALQKRYLRPDGSDIWVNLTLSVARSPYVEPYLVAVMEDISENKRIEQVLRQREEQYRELVEGTHDLVATVDLEGKFRFLNHASKTFFGLEPEAGIGRLAWDFVHPDDLESTQRLFGEWVNSDHPVLTFENRQISTDGTVRTVAWNINGHYDTNGRLAGLNGIGRDMTPLLVAREQVARLNRLRQVVSDINQALVRIRNRQELIDTVVETFATKGGFEFVWIGLKNPEDGKTCPGAWSTACGTFLDHICEPGHGALKYRGMITLAIDDQEPVYIPDLSLDERFQPEWRSAAAAYGLRSAASVPLFDGDEVVGALSVFSPVQDYFVAEEVELLEEVAGDISYAFANISRDRKLEETVRALELERGFLQQVIDASPTHFFLKRADGAYLIVNRIMKELFGISGESVAGKPFTTLSSRVRTDIELMRRQDEDVVRLRQTVVCSGVPMIDYEGTEHFMHVVKTPILDEDGTVLYIVGNVIDITDLKRAELETARQRDQIEAQARQLRETSEEVEAFAYHVSHDLRAPLRHISGFSDLLAGELGDRLNAQEREYLDRITQAAHRMTNLVESLLRLSRSQVVSIRREPVDISTMAMDIVGVLRESYPERVVRVEIEPDLQAEGDRALLEIVIDNLLRNAWKYTAKRAEAVIEVGVDVLDGVPAYFVRDNGIGFDASLSHRLFVPFSRLHEVEEFDGLGIGLAMVKRIVERHGGTIRAVGKPDEGATFLFTLTSQRS